MEQIVKFQFRQFWRRQRIKRKCSTGFDGFDGLNKRDDPFGIVFGDPSFCWFREVVIT